MPRLTHLPQRSGQGSKTALVVRKSSIMHRWARGSTRGAGRQGLDWNERHTIPRDDVAKTGLGLSWYSATLECLGLATYAAARRCNDGATILRCAVDETQTEGSSNPGTRDGSSL